MPDKKVEPKAKAQAGMELLKELNLPRGEPIYRDKPRLLEALAAGAAAPTPEIVNGKQMPSFSTSLYSQVQPLPLPTPVNDPMPARPPKREGGLWDHFLKSGNFGSAALEQAQYQNKVEDRGRRLDNYIDERERVKALNAAQNDPLHRANLEQEFLRQRRSALGMAAGPTDVPPVDPTMFGR